MKIPLFLRIAITLVAGLLPTGLYAADPPKLGEKAPDFTLSTLDDQTIRLGDLTANGKVVLVLLRGWPGYQCPLCTQQVHDYIAAAPGFAKAEAHVVMVYPGLVGDLKAHAKDFLSNKDWPKDFTFVIDPDFSMVNAYGLRWNAPNETSYPSTFVLDRKGVIRFEKISHNHGDRTKATDILEQLKGLRDN